VKAMLSQDGEYFTRLAKGQDPKVGYSGTSVKTSATPL
jgi:hypothetical protein